MGFGFGIVLLSTNIVLGSVSRVLSMEAEPKSYSRRSALDSKKVAIVTAGGSGMGAAAARGLAEDGFHVAVLSSSGKGEALG